MVEQLLTWDGDLISKSYRSASRVDVNLITPKSVAYLCDLGLLPKKLSGSVTP
jgi:hypothetical protein